MYLADGPLFESTFVLNGETITANPDGTLPAMEPVRDAGALRLPETSIAFVVLTDAAADARLSTT